MEEVTKLQKVIYDLYLYTNTCLDSVNPVHSPTFDTIKLHQFSTHAQINHIKKVLHALTSTKNGNAQLKASTKEKDEDYELILQQTEEELRSHVRVEQQLKIIIDSIQAELEDTKKQSQMLRETNKILQNENLNQKLLLTEQTNQILSLKTINSDLITKHKPRSISYSKSGSTCTKTLAQNSGIGSPNPHTCCHATKKCPKLNEKPKKSFHSQFSRSRYSVPTELCNQSESRNVNNYTIYKNGKEGTKPYRTISNQNRKLNATRNYRRMQSQYDIPESNEILDDRIRHNNSLLILH